MLKKIFSHTLIYGFAPHLPKLITLFIYPLLTENLTELDYGVTGIMASYLGVLLIFNTLGLRLILVNSFYHHRDHFVKRWRYVYGILRIWLILFNFLQALLLYFIIPEEASDNVLIIITLTVFPSMLFGPVGMIFSTYYQLKEKPLMVTSRSVIVGAVTVIITYFTIVELKMGYMGWIWASFFGSLLGGFMYWFHLHFKLKIKPIIAFKPKIIRKYLKVSLPVVPHQYSIYLLDASDRLVMDQMNTSTEEIGKYNFAYGFGNYFSMFSMAIGLAIGPLLNQKLKDQKFTDYRDVIFAIQLLFFAISFIVSLWCKEIFQILVNNDVLSSLYPLAIIIIMSYNYRPLYLAVSIRLLFYEKTNKLWRISFVAGILNLCLNIILIPVFGYKVAAITTFFALLFMGYSGFFLSVYKQLHKIKFYPLMWFALQLGLTALVFYLKDEGYILKSLISIFMITPFVFWVYLKRKLFLENIS